MSIYTVVKAVLPAPNILSWKLFTNTTYNGVSVIIKSFVDMT